MDLWTMSQDKEMLCKAECVELMHDDPVYAKIYPNGKFPDLIVGCYEKQRALEVLGEIQKLLMYDVVLFKNFDISPNDLESFAIDNACVYSSKDGNTQIEHIQRNCVVFEMPEE